MSHCTKLTMLQIKKQGAKALFEKQKDHCASGLGNGEDSASG